MVRRNRRAGAGARLARALLALAALVTLGGASCGGEREERKTAERKALEPPQPREKRRHASAVLVEVKKSGCLGAVSFDFAGETGSDPTGCTAPCAYVKQGGHVTFRAVPRADKKAFVVEFPDEPGAAGKAHSPFEGAAKRLPVVGESPQQKVTGALAARYDFDLKPDGTPDCSGTDPQLIPD